MSTDNEIVEMPYPIELYAGPHDGDRIQLHRWPPPHILFVNDDKAHRHVIAQSKGITEFATRITVGPNPSPGCVAYCLGSLLSDGVIRYLFDPSFLTKEMN